MKLRSKCLVILCAVITAFSFAQETSHIPTTVSPQMQELIGAKNNVWNIKPNDAESWNNFSNMMYEGSIDGVEKLIDYYQVDVKSQKVGGVDTYLVTPNQEYDKSKILLFLHGGGYVIGKGMSGLTEAVYMAGLGGYQILSVDYRMAPEYPYPYAVDDAFTVYKELLKTYKPENIGVFGTSTGGGMTLILTLMCKDNKVSMPAAIAPLTPWTEFEKIGDTYYTNEYVDNTLVSYHGWLEDAVKAYAGENNLKDPYISPVYADTTGFPPTLLVSGTRDLFLSNTVRMQENLLEHNVDTNLIVYEGQSHAQYYFGFNSKETLFHFRNLKQFFDKHLK